ncbi:MAG: hypothetical protein ABSE73_00935 [Planctomycetota bacterium]
MNQEPGKKAVLRGKYVCVEAEIVKAAVPDGNLRERYLARAGEDWVEVAVAEGLSVGTVGLTITGSSFFIGSAQSVTVAEGALTEELDISGQKVLRKISLVEDGPWVHVTTRLEAHGEHEIHAFCERFRFVRQPDWTFSPSVGGFNPDAQYKAPLILVQEARLAFGIVPDLAALDREKLQLCNHALDLDVPGGPFDHFFEPDKPVGPDLTVGFVPAKRVRHSVYAEDPLRKWKPQGVVENSYYLLITATAEPAQAFREAVRLHWARFGRAQQAHAARQQVGTADRKLQLWEDYRAAVWEKMSPQEWVAIPLPNGKTGGGVRTRRLFPNSVYLSAWFNTLRTSFGMALYARRTGKDELLKLAAQTVTLALNTPGVDGAFKCIAAVDDKQGVQWAAGDGCGGSTREGYLGYDMSWTGYWLLKWRAAQLPGAEDILPRCQKLARFLISRQQPDGMFPTFFKEDGSVLKDKSAIVLAETGPVTLFLLQLYEQEKDPEYLAAAKRGLAFLEKEVIPLRKWYDFETFWSCSPRGIAFDQRAALWPANNLALTQSTAAYLQAWRVTEDKAYLEKGECLLDYLLLYQQCWTNPVLQGLTCPTMLLGGFTTQNSDAEWSDARQSQCGNILLDYYRATGKVEYLERGVAALRAQFPISPSENWAHEGYGNKAGVSSFHWGYGSGMAGIEMEEDFLRDAIVDVAAQRGVGVNGLDLTECQLAGDKLALKLSSPFDWPRKPVLMLRGAAPEKRYTLVINEAVVGTFGGAELGKGVEVSPVKEQAGDKAR